jgi:NADP-dependent 3-hydroxy acid dehydrogenase YdfG
VAGRRAGLGAAVYNFTKFGVTGFSEALRLEALNQNIKVTVVEPGFVDTELQGHNTNPMVLDFIKQAKESMGTILAADDIAEGILYAVSQPEHVNAAEILIVPTRQAR